MCVMCDDKKGKQIDRKPICVQLNFKNITA